MFLTRTHQGILPILLVSLVSITSAQQQQNSTSGSGSGSTQYTDDKLFQEAVLNVTNTYRRQHNATGLVWNETLADVARSWSEGCVFGHSGGPYGENLASGYANVSESIVAWGQERGEYNFRGGEFSTQTGHFTQLVWKATKSVGCGRTNCTDSGKSAPGWFLVCEYYPGGNVIGNFVDNVQDEVPADQRPEGPDDPSVPDEDDEKGGAARWNGVEKWGWSVVGFVGVGLGVGW
ncbi:CAP domain-containing protein [Paraphoma chrysanthemicola]|uniref:CAP domain-containing protein n=1 Tax=Paraphoma chrysanthemicola TaxID=798071 RepID=A0A8K0QYK8_9PLEO|nr:CAP domain-containing protein [Paraphoma chrysanthemicola]